MGIDLNAAMSIPRSARIACTHLDDRPIPVQRNWQYQRKRWSHARYDSPTRELEGCTGGGQRSTPSKPAESSVRARGRSGGGCTPRAEFRNELTHRAKCWGQRLEHGRSEPGRQGAVYEGAAQSSGTEAVAEHPFICL